MEENQNSTHRCLRKSLLMSTLALGQLERPTMNLKDTELESCLNI